MTNENDGTDYEAALLHPSTKDTLRACTYRVIEVKDTLLIKLHGNEWLYVSPRTEIFTYLCSDKPAESTKLKDRGLIRMKPECKGYSCKVKLIK